MAPQTRVELGGGGGGNVGLQGAPLSWDNHSCSEAFKLGPTPTLPRRPDPTCLWDSTLPCSITIRGSPGAVGDPPLHATGTQSAPVHQALGCSCERDMRGLCPRQAWDLGGEEAPGQGTARGTAGDRLKGGTAELASKGGAAPGGNPPLSPPQPARRPRTLPAAVTRSGTH